MDEKRRKTNSHLNPRNAKVNFAAVLVAVWSFFLVVCPAVYIVVLSFLTRENRNIVFKFTTENYERIVDPLYLHIYVNSLIIALIASLAALLIGYPFAYFTAQLRKSARYTVLLFIMLPFWTSSLLRIYGWKTLLQNDGVFNTILLKLGFIGEPQSMLGSFGAVLAGTVYMLLPLMIMPIYNSADKVDASLTEASRDLGAGRIKTFFNITLPLTAPGIAGGVTLVFIPAVGLFFISDLLGGAKTMLLGNLIESQVKSIGNKPFAAALSVVMALMVVVFVFIFRKISAKYEKNMGQ